MNNLENLLANNQAMLIKILSNMDDVDCYFDCPAQQLCIHDADTRQMGCAATRATWLLQEYVKPDSWDQIEADVKKNHIEYWRCADIVDCEDCPSRFSNGRTPFEYYGVDCCAHAQARDLVARCKQVAAEGGF